MNPDIIENKDTENKESNKESKKTTPFHVVIESLADEVRKLEENLPEGLANPTLHHSFELKDGMQVKISIGRHVNDDDE